MRGTAAALAVTVALSTAGVAFAGSEARQPSLQILDTAPLTVRGTSFKAGERVTLLVNVGKPLTKAVKAGPRGGFTARLAVRPGGGTAIVVQAIGARGSRAMADVTKPDCNELP